MNNPYIRGEASQNTNNLTGRALLRYLRGKLNSSNLDISSATEDHLDCTSLGIFVSQSRLSLHRTLNINLNLTVMGVGQLQYLIDPYQGHNYIRELFLIQSYGGLKYCPLSLMVLVV